MGYLQGRVALVTGGGRGVGRGIALALAEEGASVAVNYHRDESAAEATVKEINAKWLFAKAYKASIDSWDDCVAMVEAVRSELGPVTILVNNAGIASRGQSVADTDPAEVERVIRTHSLGPHQLCKLVIPGMRAFGRGDIVMISSAATSIIPAGGAPYNMAKVAMEALAVTLAKEERENGIRANIVAPGLVATDMGDRFARAMFGVEDAMALDARSPFGRVCRPEDVAGAVMFLLSRQATHVTGQRITLDGGEPSVVMPRPTEPGAPALTGAPT